MQSEDVDNFIYVFDVDGVLCDIAKPINKEVVKYLARLLETPAYVAINTGRGYDRIDSELVELLLNVLNTKNSIDRLFISTEMGGVVTTFKNSEEQQRNTEYQVAAEVKAKSIELYRSSGSDEFMLNYEKQSMATFVKLDEVTFEEFEKQKSKLVNLLQNEFKGQDITIATTAESVDVHSSQAGKQTGAKLIMDWVKSVSNIQHDGFVCFGDSNGDYEMARYFATQDAQTTFVFTGESLNADMHTKVQVIDTDALYTAGTIEYLSQLFFIKE